MKDIYKNPIFYYALVPAVIVLWPLLIWSVYLPNARTDWGREKTQYEKAQKIIAEILSLDPDRLTLAEGKNTSAEFDYAIAVEKTATIHSIPPSSYKLSSGMVITSGGQKNQSARVSLKAVDITRFAKFLSAIQLRWSNLQCAQLKLRKKKGSPDLWDVELDFKYYY